MTSRREKLIASMLTDEHSEQSEKALDVVVRVVLADMGKFYCEFHKSDGPGAMVFQPKSQDASMFYMPVGALHDWREDYPEAAQDIQRIIEACLKVNPLEQAAYLIVDEDGFRFSIVDYNKTAESDNVLTD